MRYNLFIYLFINIIILTCESGCPLFSLLVTRKTTVYKKENISPNDINTVKSETNKLLTLENNSVTTSNICKTTTPVENISELSTLKNTNKNSDPPFNKEKKENANTDSNTEENNKKKALLKILLKMFS